MNRSLKILSSIVGITLFFIIFSNNIFAEPIIIRTSRDYFPATYLTDKGWEGMDIDIINEIFMRVKLDFKIVERPFKRSLYQMKDGQIDFMPNLSKNDERSAYMYWLGPTRITGTGLIVLKKDQELPIKTCNDLIIVARQKKKKFGYLIGASYSDFFDNRLRNDSSLKDALHFMVKTDQGINMLQAGRIIGYIGDDFENLARIMDQSPNRDKRYAGFALHSYRIEGSVSGAYIGISKKLGKTYYQKIKMAFQSMKDDGTFGKIHLKWIGRKPAF